MIAIEVLLVFPVFGMGCGAMGVGSMMGGTWSHMGTGSGLGGWTVLLAPLMQLLFLLVIVGLGYALYRGITDGDTTDQALTKLRAAYARGDIDDDEFRRRRKVLDEGL
ncbi:MAG: SHOCT domain-containing protein [Halorhabdus sp.]